jgi:hypothetical protein
MLSDISASRLDSRTATLTFAKVFDSKKTELARKLDVTDELLRKLDDAHIIDKASSEKIREKFRNDRKVDELLSVVQRRDDTLLPEFCKILKDIGQSHVVKLILPHGHSLRFELLPDELDPELIVIVEPRYGLPGDLYSKEVINLNQREIIDEATSVNDQVLRLLNAVRQNYQHLKVDAFLQALEEHDQPHVVNFIKTNGKIGDEFGDVRPLNDQQRRRLWSTQDVVSKLDLQEGRFLDRLRAKAVISDVQQKDVDVKSKQSHHESIQLLIKILERRSVANLKQFISCLDETKQTSVVQWLNDKGVVGCLRSTMDKPTVSMEDECEMEAKFVELFNDLVRRKEYDLAGRIWELMEKNGFKITCAKTGTSIMWYIMCHTVEKLETLRRLYESPSKLLNRLLQFIFCQVCVNSYSLQLSVEWTAEDFKTCRRFLTETSGRPFELPRCHDEPPTEPLCVVSIDGRTLVKAFSKFNYEQTYIKTENVN